MLALSAIDVSLHYYYMQNFQKKKKKIRPPPIIASISCEGLKFTPKSAHPIHLVRKVFECNMMQG